LPSCVSEVSAIQNLVGVEGVQSIGRAEVHGSARRLGEGAHVEFHAAEPVADGIIAEGFRGRVEAREAVVGAEPEAAAFIFEDAVDHVVRQAILFGVNLERGGGRVESVQSAARGGYPDRSIRSLGDVENGIVGETARPFWVGAELLKRTALGIVAEQPIFGGSHPQGAGTLEMQRDHASERFGRVGGCELLRVENFLFAVKADQSVARPEPEFTVRAFRDGVDHFESVLFVLAGIVAERCKVAGL